ncbi:MAG TPA: hypothetical protein VKU00_34100 [Chthonomonadaceae bacterium]|nr:hypothetical protein [Chthonomonadaceae bacterium]
MNNLNTPEREHLILFAHEANTLEEIEQATDALRQWVRQHPEDLGIRDAFEPLSHRKDFLQTEASKSERAFEVTSK